jgi:predicted Zn-dependent peptidase
MKYNTHTLPNGLRIIHAPNQSAVAYCGFAIDAGTRDEADNEQGMAHFVEHLIFKGTQKRHAWHILNRMEHVGGDLNAYTNKEDTVYYAAVLGTHLPKAVDLLTDIVFHSTYPQAEISKEIEVVCDEIESYNDSPAELIYDEFENIIFAGHDLGHSILGTAEQLRTYTSDSIKRFASRYYKPSNAVFFAYGNVDFNKLVRMLTRATSDFADAKPNLEDCKLDGMARLPQYIPTKKVIDKGTHQAHVMIGTRTFSIHEEKRIALYLLNNILGGPGMSARLNLALRERRGLVYTVDSSMTSYSDTGAWSVYFGCDPHDISKCQKLVMAELQRVADKPLTPLQLATAKRQIKGQIAIACDNRESYALDLGKSYLHYGWEKDIDRLFAQIDKLTADDIQQVAKDVFAPEKLSVLVVK